MMSRPRLGQRAILRALTVLALTGLLSACGGGGGGGSPGTAPTASNLSYSPHGGYLGASGGTATINGRIDFSDPDGDLASWSLTVLDSGGNVLQSAEQPITGAGGSTSGTLVATVLVGTSQLGTYTFTIALVDARGLRSAPVSGTFSITPFPWAVQSGPPLARPGFATVSLGGRIYVMGGTDPTTGTVPAPPITRVDVFDPATSSWSSAPPMARPMSDFVAVASGGQIFAVGPTDAHRLTIETQTFDPTAGRWAVLTAPPGQRSDQGGALAGGRLYTMGGRSGGFEAAGVESFDPVGGSWRSNRSMPSARSALSAIAIERAGSVRVWALGGYRSTEISDGGFLRTVELYDPVNDGWVPTAPMPQAAAHVALATLDDRLYTFGGDNVSRALDTVYRYDLAGGVWTARAALPAPATRLRAEVAGRRIFVFSSSAVWVYTPDDDRW